MEEYRRLLKYIKPYTKLFILSVFCSAFVSLLTAANAWLVKPVLDDIFINKNLFMLKVLPIVILVVTLLKGVFNYAQTYLMRFIGNKVIKDLREQLFYKILSLPLPYYNQTSSGHIMSRLINDVGSMQNAVSSVVKDGLQQAATIIGLIFVMFYQDWKLALFTTIILPIGYFPLVRFSSRLRKISSLTQKKIADLTQFIQEKITGIKIVKSYSHEEAELEIFAQKNELFFHNTMKAIHVSELAAPIMNMAGAAGVAFIIWYGGKQVIDGHTTTGTFFSFLTASLMMYAPIRSLTMANNEIQRALASAKRVFEVMDMEDETDIHDLSKREFFQPDNIRFNNVSFKYSETGETILNNISFEVKKGEVVAFVGKSGAGKTTIANLIPRFYNLTGGEILFDGINTEEISLKSLRKNIGVVTQETILFDDTIKNNIAYGIKETTIEDVMSASKAAYIHDFIISLPDGYDTMVGEKGVRLSGGEKQRIAIARAILKGAPILILDEATSALDSQAENMVQKAIFNLIKNRTTFIIAHRLSTIKNASKIITIENGKIAEIGSHDELLSKKGNYYELYNLQFAEYENLH